MLQSASAFAHCTFRIAQVWLVHFASYQFEGHCTMSSKRRKVSASRDYNDCAHIVDTTRTFQMGNSSVKSVVHEALKLIMQTVNNFVDAAPTPLHLQSLACMPEDDVMQACSRQFELTVQSMLRNYAKLLNDSLQDAVSSEMIDDVQELGLTILWQLNVQSAEAAVQGEDVMDHIVKVQQSEFRWNKVLEILDLATRIAQSGKRKAIANLEVLKEELLCLRRDGDVHPIG